MSRLARRPPLRLPVHYAPLTYGIFQAAITTAVATGIATYQLAGISMKFLEQWTWAWSVAWVTMLPVVVAVAPLIQRAVLRLTQPRL